MIGRYLVSMLIAVALAACGRDGSAATLNAPIQLAPGQSAVFDAADLEVKFVSIDVPDGGAGINRSSATEISWGPLKLFTSFTVTIPL